MKIFRIPLPREEGQSLVECGCWMFLGVLVLGCLASAIGAVVTRVVSPEGDYRSWLVAAVVAVFLVLLAVAGLFIRKNWARFSGRFFVKWHRDH